MAADAAHSESGAGNDSARRTAVLAELERVLNSAAFRNARRSQEFLRYVVVNALEGHSESLKERTIGASVFQRPPDYDTGDDSIVRVKASELRKRLAHYYLESGAADEVRIEMPAGSYVPEFRWLASAAEATTPPSAGPRKRRFGWLPFAVLAAVVCLAAAAIWYTRGVPAPALEQFWGPVLSAPRPVLLCVAHPAVYHLRGRTSDLVRGRPEAMPETIPSADIIRDADNFVGIGDAFALGQLSGFLSRHGKQVVIRMGNDTSFADLRNSPAVLIGAFTNQWTLQMTSNLRFVFDWEGSQPIIRDQMDPARRWRRGEAGPDSDYVLVSRVFDSRSGDVVITAAGLAHLGTQMAGEFLTNPAYLEQSVRGAPPDWKRRNLQLVLTGEVIGKTPGPPKVVESWYW